MPINWQKAEQERQESMPRQKLWNAGTDSAGNLTGYEGVVVFLEAPRELTSGKTGEKFSVVKVMRADPESVAPIEETMALSKKGLRDAVAKLPFPDSIGKRFVLGVSSKKIKTADGLRSYVPVALYAYEDAVSKGVWTEE